MVDPDAVDDAVIDQVEQQAVDVLEHRLVLDPDADQAGHVEEAAVAQAVASRSANAPAARAARRGARVIASGVAARARPPRSGPAGERHAQAAESRGPGRRHRPRPASAALGQHRLERRGQPGQADPLGRRVEVEMAGVAAGRRRAAGRRAATAFRSRTPCGSARCRAPGPAPRPSARPTAARSPARPPIAGSISVGSVTS